MFLTNSSFQVVDDTSQDLIFVSHKPVSEYLHSCSTTCRVSGLFLGCE